MLTIGLLVVEKRACCPGQQGQKTYSGLCWLKNELVERLNKHKKHTVVEIG